MNNNTLTLKEISKQSFDTLVKSGYSPKYTDDDHIEFDCNIAGVKFSFYPIEDDIFGYSAEFNLKEELPTVERARLKQIFMQTDSEDIVFENFHINGKLVHLSSAFICDRYPDGFIEESIRILLSTNGIVPELKIKSIIRQEK